MKKYVVYFAKNKEFLKRNEFAFEYSVDASSEDEAKQKAIIEFHRGNSELNLSDFTVGFSQN